MDLDTSHQINPHDPSWRPESPDSLPEIEHEANRIDHDVPPKADPEHTSEPSKKLTLDDLTQLLKKGDMPSQTTSISPNSSFDSAIDLSSPQSSQSPPRTYTPSSLWTIPEEETGDMELSDDDMPDLEEGGGVSIFLDTSEYNHNHSNQNEGQCNGFLLEIAEEQDTSHHQDPSASTSASNIEINNTTSNASSEPEKGEPPRPCIHIDWSFWPPDDAYERDLCERVCEEVAILYGFREVVIE